jgi:hypothetical protein
MSKNIEYRKGAEARKNFETTMTKLFRAQKPPMYGRADT